jgi:hypothetical protein
MQLCSYSIGFIAKAGSEVRHATSRSAESGVGAMEGTSLHVVAGMSFARRARSFTLTARRQPTEGVKEVILHRPSFAAVKRYET